MQTILKHKGIIIGVVVIVVVIVGYMAVKGSGSQSSTSGGVTKQAVSQTGNSSSAAVTGPGQEFVSQLLAIQNINLNLDVFTDPVFIGLQDFSHEIPLQPISRPNPFAPVDLNEVSVSSDNTAPQEKPAAPTGKPTATKPGAEPTVTPPSGGGANPITSTLKKKSSTKATSPGSLPGASSGGSSGSGAPAGDIFQALPTN